jgi:hypothetical protein
VAAQSTFAGLRAKVKTGDRVEVYDDRGKLTTGRVQSISDTELVVRGPAVRTFGPDEVIRVRKPGPIWDGAVKGALGFLVPSLIVQQKCSYCTDAKGVASSTVFGAIFGLGIDAAIGPKTVYRRDAQSRITLVPLVGSDRRGFAATFRF